MAEETLILNIEIDQGAGLKALEQSEKAMLDLKNQQKELNDSLKAGTITQEQYAQSKVQLDQKIQSETANRKTLTQTINTESNSLNAQKLRLKELITERNNIDRSTVAGAKKFDEMNKSIKSLNGSIKSAEEQGGSFQRNVGNYKGTIDQFTGGAYSAAQGVGAITKASLAFIATPIGAIIAAIGVALASLTAYFKGSEEGQNALNKIMTIGGQIMERLTDILEDVGKFLFEAFTNPKEAIQDLFNFLKDNIINRFTAFATILEGITSLDFKKVANGVIQAGTGIENVVDKVIMVGDEATKIIDKAVEDGTRLANMQANLDKSERKMIEDTAKRKLEISELRRKADEAEGENKLKFLNEALALEKINAEEELKNAQLKRDIAAEEVTLNGATKDALDKQAKAEADLNNAKAAFFENTRKMNKERIATENQVNDETLKRIDSEKALADAEAKRVAKSLEINEEQLEEFKEDAKERVTVTDKAFDEMFEDIAETAEADIETNDAATDAYIEGIKKRREAQEKLKEAIIPIVEGTAAVTSDIFAKATMARLHELDNELNAVKLKEQQELKALQEKLDKGEISEEDYKNAKAEIERQALRDQDEIKRKAFEADKVNRISQSIIDAIQAGLAAFRALAGIPIVGPALGAVAAAAAVAFGYKQVDLIRKEQYVPGGFAEGGFTGEGGKHQVAGVVHKGEYVVPAHLVKNPMYAGSLAMLETARLRGFQDGGLVKNEATAMIDQNVALANAFKNLPPAYVSWREWRDINNQMANKAMVTESR